MGKQLKIFPDGMMQNVLINQLQAEIRAKEIIIQDQKKTITAYKGHFTKKHKRNGK